MSAPSGFEFEYGWGGRLVVDAVWPAQLKPAIEDRGQVLKSYIPDQSQLQRTILCRAPMLDFKT
jgi:hypothetical protein